MTSPFTMKRAVIEVGRWMHQRGLIAGIDGSISNRIDSDRILITPANHPLERLSPDDLVLVDINGKKLQGRLAASTEMPLHLLVYKNRPEIQACIHANPPFTTAFAIAGVDLSEGILPEVIVYVGKIPLCDYAPPGTDQALRLLEPLIEDNNAIVLQNHGLLTIGRSLDEAYNRHDAVEHYARIVHLARQLGSVNCLPSEDYERLDKIRQKLDATWDDNS